MGVWLLVCVTMASACHEHLCPAGTFCGPHGCVSYLDPPAAALRGARAALAAACVQELALYHELFYLAQIRMDAIRCGRHGCAVAFTRTALLPSTDLTPDAYHRRTHRTVSRVERVDGRWMAFCPASNTGVL